MQLLVSCRRISCGRIRYFSNTTPNRKADHQKQWKAGSPSPVSATHCAKPYQWSFWRDCTASWNKNQPQRLEENAVCHTWQVKLNVHIQFLYMGSNIEHSTSFLFLPGSTVEFYSHTADSGCTVDTTDRGSACLITLDADAFCDSESVHIQIKRAMVLSVKRRGVTATVKEESRFDWSVLYREEIFCYSHYSKVLDPPVSVQTDEGISNGQSDTSPWHQTHCRLWQSHIHYFHTGRNNILVCNSTCGKILQVS